MNNKIGKYEIQAEIGRGGFGQVYRAYDPTVGRVVAIKVMNAIDDPELVARFHREAMAAGNLHNKNIITVYEFGEFEGAPFMVMEYLQGENLQAVIQSGREMTLVEKMRIMSQVAEGLHCAHQHGVIHRDVKPANIMLLPDGTVKIMDFGIARLTDSDSTRQTRTGFLIGTILYMSPEQFRGAKLDLLCDIWAYGVIYYELLTGKHPFAGPDIATTMYRINNEEPPAVRTVVPDCPQELERIVHRALAKEREVRYASLEDLRFDMQPILVDLEKYQASNLLADAHRLLAETQWDAAHSVVRRVLELDPGNKEARQLREQIQQQLHRQSVQPRIEALVKSGEEAVASRRFQDAIPLFESALRLNPADSGIRIRMDTARKLMEECAVAARLFAEASQDLQMQNLTGAFRRVCEGLRSDPHNSEARELYKTIQQEISSRERTRHLQEGLTKAKRMLLIQSFEEATALLEGLATEHPEAAPVKDLLVEALNARQQHQLQQRRQEELKSIRTQLRERRYADAVGRLRSLKAEFPSDAEIGQLVSLAEEEVVAAQRAAMIDGIRRQAEACLATQNYDAALDVIEQGLQSNPGDTLLVRLLQSTVAAKNEFERKSAVAQVLEQCDQLRARDQVGEALELVEASLLRYIDEPLLIAIEKQLRQEWQEMERRRFTRDALSRAAQMIHRGEWDAVRKVLQNALERYPGTPELLSALDRVEKRAQSMTITTRAMKVPGSM